MLIESKMNVLPGVAMCERVQGQIKNEPMLFNCNEEHARHLGGPLTQEFLDLLPPGWGGGPLVIDSRVHMLMPGWYPRIPGWHHDDVPRTRIDGQPNYGPGQIRSEHIMALVGGEVCQTEFALGDAEFEEPPIDYAIYSLWHQRVEFLLLCGLLTKARVPTNRLIEFNDRSWHQGVPAVSSGWRFFIRASRYFAPSGERIDRPNQRTNEVRQQVQVYLPSVNAGW